MGGSRGSCLATTHSKHSDATGLPRRPHDAADCVSATSALFAMKICVYGAGAVGGALAARLSRAGNLISVVARGAHGQAMRQAGVTLLTESDRFTAKVHCVEDPAELPPQDVVIVTVKGPALPGIADTLRRMTTQASRVVFVMNGIPWWFCDGLGVSLPEAALDSLDPGSRLRQAIGLDQTIGGVVYSSNEVVEPGVVTRTLVSATQHCAGVRTM